MPTWELAIALFDSDNPKGAKAYDVVLARPFTGVYGVKERKQFLWIPVDDIDDVLAGQITDHVLDAKQEIKKKNRYKILKPQIENLDAGVVFDEKRAKDLKQDYQPFEKKRPFKVSALLTDTEAVAKGGGR